MIPPVLQLMGPGSDIYMRHLAAAALGRLAASGDNADIVAAGGGIPLLVQILRVPGSPGCTAAAQRSAATTLCVLAGHADDAVRATIAATSASPLVELLGSADPDVTLSALAALSALSEDEDAAVTISVAGAVPALVRLIGPGYSVIMQETAAGVLVNLARVASIAVNIAGAGAIPPLVQLLLRSDGTALMRQWGASALSNLTRLDRGMSVTDIAVTDIAVIAGAIPALVHLLGPDCTALMQGPAATSLGNLARRDGVVDAIVAAGAIPALARLSRRAGADARVRESAGFSLEAIRRSIATRRDSVAAPRGGNSNIEF